MSDFFDNENTTEIVEETAKKEIKPKKVWPKILAAAICLSVLITGTWAANKFIPKKDDEDSSSTDSKTIDVLNLDKNDVSYVSVTNQNGTFKLVSEEEETSEENNTKTWYLDGVATELQSSSKASSVVTSATSITAIKKITQKSEENCGFDNSSISALVVLNDGSEVSIVFGDDSPDNVGCYLKTSKSDDIYLADKSIKEDLLFDYLSFASTEAIPGITAEGLDDYFTDGTLAKFDSLTVSGKNYDTPLKIVMNTDESFSEYIPYKIVSPEEHYADEIDSIVEFFSSGLTVEGAYSYDTSESELSKFGLNNPDLKLEMVLGSQHHYYLFKTQEDGGCAVYSNRSKLINKVSASTIQTLSNGKASDYYSSVICLFNIDDLNSFEVSSNDYSYNFGIKATDDENSEDKYKISLNGEKIDCSSFQNFYQYVLTLGCYDFTTDNTDKNDSVTLKYSFKDGEIVSLTFERANDTKYQYSINGKPIGKIQSSKIDKLQKYVKKLANGEKISDMN